jgi:hypothetical protein
MKSREGFHITGTLLSYSDATRQARKSLKMEKWTIKKEKE